MFYIAVVSNMTDAKVYGPYDSEESAQSEIDSLPESVFESGDSFFSIIQINSMESFITDSMPDDEGEY